MKDKFLKLGEFIGVYGIIATAIGYIIGTAATGLFESWTSDIFIPLFINPWMDDKTKTVKIFGKDILFRPFLTKILIFITTLFTLYFLIGIIGRLPESIGLVKK